MACATNRKFMRNLYKRSMERKFTLLHLPSMVKEKNMDIITQVLQIVQGCYADELEQNLYNSENFECSHCGHNCLYGGRNCQDETVSIS